jgi:sterol desaturase/sphingolipid hydroxylase (fatty acid hydroxylase superfamily)
MTAQALEDYQPLLVLALLAATTLLETARPFVESAIPRWRHARRNLGIGALAFIAFGATGFLKAGAAAWVGARGVGLLNLVHLPWPIRIAASLLAFDLIDYLFHRLQHGVPWMWRFHRVHHSDPRLDASTSLRFHPVEGAAQTIFQAVAIVIVGIELDAMAIFDTLLLTLLYVQHANVAWPARLDRLLRIAFVTPDVHHVHHSREQRFTDSNFADVFTLWDRLFGTYEEAPDRRAIAYGLEEFDGDAHQTVQGMALMPLAPVARAVSAFRDDARIEAVR